MLPVSCWASVASAFCVMACRNAAVLILRFIYILYLSLCKLHKLFLQCIDVVHCDIGVPCYQTRLRCLLSAATLHSIPCCPILSCYVSFVHKHV
jgi:hypothetical protein